MTFGDGISWKKFVDEILEETKGDVSKLFYKHDPNDPNDLIIKNIKKYKPNGGKLLDCGCNISRWIEYFEDAGFIYTGIDQETYAIKIAKKYHPNGDFRIGFLWNIRFENEFDLIFCNNVLQHNTLEEKKRILPLLRKALKYDSTGLLFINESTVLSETMTQLTYDGWIKFIESYGFKFIESWQKNDIGLDEAYLFKSI